MARVEDGGQSDAGLQGGHHDAVHFVVDDVAGGAEVDGVDDFVVAVVFVAVEVGGLAPVAWGVISKLYLGCGVEMAYTYLSSGRIASRSVAHP